MSGYCDVCGDTICTCEEAENQFPAATKMIKVYLCYEISFVGSFGEFRQQLVMKVFSNEEKALAWCAEFESTEFEWREYEIYEVEE